MTSASVISLIDSDDLRDDSFLQMLISSYRGTNRSSDDGNRFRITFFIQENDETNTFGSG
jgi:hypothetical protein